MRLETLLERRIARHLIKALLDGGYVVSVFAPEEDAIAYLVGSKDRTEIFKTMFSIDGTVELHVCKPRSKASGWVVFIWGNTCYCISDYHVALEDIMKPINQFTEKLSERFELT